MQAVRFKYVYLFIFLLCSIVLASEKQVEVTNFFAKLYLAPSINSKFMGLAQKGERYPILLSSNFWYRVDFKGVPVWVENSNVELFDPDAPPVAKTENIPEQNQNIATTTTNVISDSQPSNSSPLPVSTATVSTAQNVSTTLPTSGGQPMRFENKRESSTKNRIVSSKIQDYVDGSRERTFPNFLLLSRILKKSGKINFFLLQLHRQKYCLSSAQTPRF